MTKGDVEEEGEEGKGDRHREKDRLAHIMSRLEIAKG